VRDFAASAQVTSASRDRLVPPGPGGEILLAGAVRRFRALSGYEEPLELRVTTTVPREVGLGGSSAIVIAALRALSAAHDVELAVDDLARVALAVEVEECGIAAGLQDRIVQAREGLLFMDCGPTGTFEELDPARLPALYLAWLPAAAAPSGVVHAELRQRHAAGDPDVLAALSELAGLATGARDALVAGDRTELARCIDGSLELRRRLMPVDRRLTDLARVARSVGASANSTGSGGAIVGVLPSEEQWPLLSERLRAAGCATLRPTVVG
jgi:glucuronokinase